MSPKKIRKGMTVTNIASGLTDTVTDVFRRNGVVEKARVLYEPPVGPDRQDPVNLALAAQGAEQP